MLSPRHLFMCFLFVLSACVNQNAPNSGSKKIDEPANAVASDSVTVEPEKLFSAKTLLKEKEDFTAPTPEEYERLINSKIVDKYNAFGLKLFQQIAAAEPENNVAISPLSLMMALSLLYNASAGETRKEIARVLNVHDIDIQEFNKLTHILWRSVSFDDENLKVQLANSLWSHLSQDFSEDYLKNLDRYYQVRLTRLDFSDASTSTEVINQWISERTQGLIKDIVSPQTVFDSRFMLINTVYFNGLWASPFSTFNTYEDSFHGENGETSVGMMNKSRFYGDYWISPEKTQFLVSNFRRTVGLEFNYEDKTVRSIFDTVFILPNKNTDIEQELQALSTVSLSNLKKNTKGQLGYFALPKFKQSYTNLETSSHLIKLGLERTFTAPDLSNMSPGLAVDSPQLLHSTQVEFRERGVEAAAVTVITGPLPSTEQPPDLFRFEVNRPFIYLIRHKETGLILFCGIIKNLEAGI